jgi:FMN-dependent NADH-azoreductase
MKNLIKVKQNCINEIVNIIKKYNISLDEIITAYINKYENQFNENEKYINKFQFYNFNQYNKLLKEYINESNQKILTQYQIIDDYIIL